MSPAVPGVAELEVFTFWAWIVGHHWVVRLIHRPLRNDQRWPEWLGNQWKDLTRGTVVLAVARVILWVSVRMFWIEHALYFTRHVTSLWPRNLVIHQISGSLYGPILWAVLIYLWEQKVLTAGRCGDGVSIIPGTNILSHAWFPSICELLCRTAEELLVQVAVLEGHDGVSTKQRRWWCWTLYW